MYNFFFLERGLAVTFGVGVLYLYLYVHMGDTQQSALLYFSNALTSVRRVVFREIAPKPMVQQCTSKNF